MPAVGLHWGAKRKKKKKFNEEKWNGNEGIIFKQCR